MRKLLSEKKEIAFSLTDKHGGQFIAPPISRLVIKCQRRMMYHCGGQVEFVGSLGEV